MHIHKIRLDLLILGCTCINKDEKSIRYTKENDREKRERRREKEKEWRQSGADLEGAVGFPGRDHVVQVYLHV